MMKIKSLLATLLLAVLCVGFMPREASARVTFSYFYDSLQPYGDWVDVEYYGYCWQPRDVDPRWRPYTDGYWAYTDAGWTWVSYEDFGSIVYHYGRWIRLEDIGWVWKPGYEWGPAWVSWRQSDDYIGWAPLPPEVDFNPDSGIGVWVDRDYDIGPSAYNFCEYRYFGAPVIRNYILPRRENVVIINSTVNITNITFVSGHNHGRLIFNGGPDYRRLSARTDHRIELLQLMRQTDGDWLRHPRPERSRRMGSQLFIAAPDIEPPHQRFAPSRVAREIRTPRIDKGWQGITDNRERDRIKQRYQDQTRGLDRRTAPVYPLEAQKVQATMNEARALREQARDQRDQMTDDQRRAAEFTAKSARAQQQLQIDQQKAAAEQQRRLAEFNAKAARAGQEHPEIAAALRAQQQQQQQQPAAEQQRRPEGARPQPEAQPQQPQNPGRPQRRPEGARPQQEAQAQQQQAAAEQQRRSEGVRSQQEALARQQQAAAEQQRRSEGVRAQQEAQARQQQAAAEQQRRAEGARAQQEAQARQQQAAAEQQHKAAEFSARAARAQQEAQARQQQAAAEQQHKAAEFSARAARAQQEAAQKAQASPAPDDNDPKKRKHRDRD